ncbi:MAG: hypothetical protein M3071_07750, partial [Actinomycetota bacterium]|nr:hypothetical protein [Actinomycetota bacterium]
TNSALSARPAAPRRTDKPGQARPPAPGQARHRGPAHRPPKPRDALPDGMGWRGNGSTRSASRPARRAPSRRARRLEILVVGPHFTGDAEIL